MQRYIKGYEGRYKISDSGVVTSCRRMVRNGPGKMRLIKESVVAQSDNGRGYKMVYLYKDNKRRPFYVHRLVAELLLDYSDLNEVNHIDGDKSNNRVENLEWCTRSENISHAYSSGLSRKGVRHYKFKGAIVAERCGFGYVMFGKRSIKESGFTTSYVYRCVNGKQESHKGFKFYRVKISEEIHE